MVELEWHGGPTQDTGSRVRFELTAVDGGSLLVLTHTGVTGDAASEFAAGWHSHLDTLSALAAGAEPTPGDWDQLHERYRAVVGADRR